MLAFAKFSVKWDAALGNLEVIPNGDGLSSAQPKTWLFQRARFLCGWIVTLVGVISKDLNPELTDNRTRCKRLLFYFQLSQFSINN